MNGLFILVIGTVATSYMLALHWGSERLRLVQGSMTRAIGSFLIPEPMRSWTTMEIFQFVAGIMFTTVYAYIFQFLELNSVRGFIEIGGLVGLVHGFFVSYFVLTGFAAYEEEDDEDAQFSFSEAAMNIVSHVFFGAVVGAGFGFASLKGALWPFAAYAAAVGLVIAGFVALFVPPLLQSQRDRDGHIHFGGGQGQPVSVPRRH